MHTTCSTWSPLFRSVTGVAYFDARPDIGSRTLRFISQTSGNPEDAVLEWVRESRRTTGECQARASSSEIPDRRRVAGGWPTLLDGDGVVGSALDQLARRLPRPGPAHRAALDHDLRQPPATVVVGRHAGRVRAAVVDHDQVAGLDRRQRHLLAEPVAALAHRAVDGRGY